MPLGCWAPEFAAGMCERLVEEVWTIAETKIFAFQKGNRLSEVDLERLLTNFRAARVSVLATLSIKLSVGKLCRGSYAHSGTPMK